MTRLETSSDVKRQESPLRDPELAPRNQSLLAAAKRTLEMIAGGMSLPDVLTNLCAAIDSQNSDIMSTALLMDPDGQRLWLVAGPRVPDIWKQALNPVVIGPDTGSCGTAAYREERVIIADVATDPRWSGLTGAQSREAAVGQGIRAAWSDPVMSKDGELLGTFALYYRQPRAPSDRDLQMIEDAAHIAVIAIEGQRSREALKKALLDVKRSEHQLRTIIDAIPTLAWCLHPDGRVAYVNRRWYEYTGIALEEAQRADWFRKVKPEASKSGAPFHHPEDFSRAGAKWFGEILGRKAPGEIEMRLRRRDGEYRWFLIRIEPHLDSDGNVVWWYGTNTDIEDFKRSEARVQQDERELRRITDAIPHTIIVLSPEGSVVYANKAVLDYTGLQMDEVGAENFRARVFHPDDVVRVADGRRDGLSRGQPFENEQRVRRHDGVYRWYLIRYHPVRDDQGRILRWYATGTDIDDRKRVEDQTRNENIVLREDIDRASMFEEIVGSSASLRHVLVEVAKVAPTDSTVLILGETGTGKELIARAIHKRSRRSSKAFIRVNCAAIPPALVASELFGHERGAFTGALERRLGRFEAAEGGTIFLDEVGELPSETQVALLRVLQEREFERVGSSRPIAADVRVLAATNRDLEAAVAKGTFREDLYYRLNVFPVRVPPLRDRGDDIPLLVEYLVDRYTRTAGKRIRRISRKTMDLFKSYDWPGNVRELQNVIERAVVLCEGDTFVVEGSWLKRTPGRPSSAAGQLPLTLAEQEKAMIEAALAGTRGRVAGRTGAAEKLGIPRQTLDSKIKALGIDKRRFREP